MIAFKPASSRRSALGVGTYFARDASYCDGLTDDSRALVCLDRRTRTCRVLLCLVITGVSGLGSPGAVLQQRSRGVGASGDTLFYDSGCDDLGAPEIFVVGGEGSAYPVRGLHGAPRRRGLGVAQPARRCASSRGRLSECRLCCCRMPGLCHRVRVATDRPRPQRSGDDTSPPASGRMPGGMSYC